MKKLWLVLLGCVFIPTSFAATFENLAGTYICDGYDGHDGIFKGSTLILTLDAKNSDPASGRGAYNYSVITSGDVQYKGAAVSNGNILATYFQNTGEDQSSDHGVSTSFITHDENSNGATQTVIHDFYYEPEYYGGDNGSATCVKQS
jgi:hypothetical protein